MKPYIICHMMAALDGRIDCDMTEKLEGTNEYYEALDSLKLDTCLSGKNTAVLHYTDQFFKDTDPKPACKELIYKAAEADGYTVFVDTNGTLLWEENIVDEKPLLLLLSERASVNYLEYLQVKKISYIATGAEKIDLARACAILGEQFGVKRMGIVGGGHINGSFLDAGLIDEISMMYAPGIDGREKRTAAFDGRPADREPVKLKLQSVKQFDCGTLWMRYLAG